MCLVQHNPNSIHARMKHSAMCADGDTRSVVVSSAVMTVMAMGDSSSSSCVSCRNLRSEHNITMSLMSQILISSEQLANVPSVRRHSDKTEWVCPSNVLIQVPDEVSQILMVLSSDPLANVPSVRSIQSHHSSSLPHLTSLF